MGDSSLRGGVLSLIQQLTWRSSDGSVNGSALMDVRMWPLSNQTGQPWSPHGWLDLLLVQRDADGSWEQRHVSEDFHTCPRAAGGLPRCRPGNEMSGELSPLWCSLQSKHHHHESSRHGGARRPLLRITYRQLTFLKYAEAALSENERAWEASRCQQHSGLAGPDAILFQSGVWDVDERMRQPPKESSAALLSALLALRAQAAARPRRLAYASLLAPWPGRDDSAAQWQRAMVAQANSRPIRGASDDGAGGPRLQFVDRLGWSLSESCQLGCSLPL